MARQSTELSEAMALGPNMWITISTAGISRKHWLAAFLIQLFTNQPPIEYFFHYFRCQSFGFSFKRLAGISDLVVPKRFIFGLNLVNLFFGCVQNRFRLFRPVVFQFDPMAGGLVNRCFFLFFKLFI